MCPLDRTTNRGKKRGAEKIAGGQKKAREKSRRPEKTTGGRDPERGPEREADYEGSKKRQ